MATETFQIDNSYSTIVSLLPFELTENKPGVNPTEFVIRSRHKDYGFGLTTIPNDAFYLVNPDPLADAKDVRNIKVLIPSIELSQSIIADYINALLGVELPDIVPGLFAIKGNHSDHRFVKTNFSKEITFYTNAQNKWFIRLVEMADDVWSKSKSPVTISDIQREACKLLGYERDWINPLPSELQEKCPICKSAINPGALKCIACGFILNKLEYDKLVAAVK